MQQPRGQGGRRCTPPPSLSSLCGSATPAMPCDASSRHTCCCSASAAGGDSKGEGLTLAAGSAPCARHAVRPPSFHQRGGLRRLVPITVDAPLQDRRRPAAAGLVDMAAVWPCVKSVMEGLVSSRPGCPVCVAQRRRRRRFGRLGLDAPARVSAS